MDGKCYVDFGSGIAVTNTRHRPPKIKAAAMAQMERFTHTAFQVVGYDVYIELADA
jgi:4-aminobutyrate aminotransferase / (S)-3-amino-2-methylpropionate transaminase / 5-aminovalerate transaminase